MTKKTIGFALCGSFCTFDEVFPVIEELIGRGYNIIPIMSEFSYSTDTRFGKSQDFAARLEGLTGNRLLHSILETEPIGPKSMLDLLIIAPCTGNTLGKMAAGITDSCVTMAAKAHLRNERPVLIAVSTNDALANSSKNIGNLLNYKQIYFVPMKQDAPLGKPRSIVAHFEKIPAAAELALNGKQMQPIYI